GGATATIAFAARIGRRPSGKDVPDRAPNALISDGFAGIKSSHAQRNSSPARTIARKL
ncbi:MAG: hypothetical protein ACJAUW_001816, partial [Yoonia sp.]